MRRLVPYVCVLVALLTASPAAAAKPATSWAQAELKAVVAAGLMAKEVAARPNDPLDRGAKLALRPATLVVQHRAERLE